jgi:hypothetical protein
MAINLNYSTRRQEKTPANAFGTKPTSDPSGLKRAGQSIAQIGQSFSQMAQTLDQQDKSAQNLTAQKAYALQQQAANEAAFNLTAAIDEGNNEKIIAAQEAFDQLKAKTVNDYLPENSGGISVTRDSILTNYSSQYSNLYGALDRSTRSHKNVTAATRGIDTANKQSESEWTGLNLQYGAANEVPLEMLQEYLVGGEVPKLDTNPDPEKNINILEYNALPDDKSKKAYLEGKLAIFNRSMERSFAHIKDEDDIRQFEQYYGDLFQSYTLFSNLDNPTEKYDEAVIGAYQLLQEQGVELKKEKVKAQLDRVKNANNTFLEGTTLVTSSNDTIALNAVASGIEAGVEDIDYADLEVNQILTSLATPLGPELAEAFKTASDMFGDNISEEALEAISSSLDSELSLTLKSMAMMKPEDRPEASQFWAQRPEFITIPSEYRSKFVTFFNNFTKNFDDAMARGDAFTAMKNIDPMILKLSNEGRVAEANLYYQEEYVKKGIFVDRGFPGEIANISTEGFEFGTDDIVVADRITKVFENNVGNYEALYDNIQVALSDPAYTTKAQKNLYHLMSMIMPQVIEQGHYPSSPVITGLINNFAKGVNNYEKALGTEERKDIDTLFNRLALVQDNYAKERAGDSIFGELGLKKELMFMNIYKEADTQAQQDFAERMVKGYLYTEIVTNGKSYKEAVQSLQEYEDKQLNAYEAPVPIDSWGNSFVAVLPSEARAYVETDIGQSQLQPLEELFGQLFNLDVYAGNIEGMAKARESEWAKVYTMSEIALLAVSGFDPTGNKDLIQQFNLGDTFDWQNPIYYEQETGKITRKGAKALIKGIMSNTTDDGQPIAKTLGHSYVFENGQRKKKINFGFKSGTGYSKVQAKSLFNVDDAVELAKMVMTSEQNIFNWRTPGSGFNNQNLDRLLDYMEEAQFFAPDYEPPIEPGL